MRIAFRADASAEIGIGHFKRCASLAKALEHCGTKTILVFRDLGVSPSAEILGSFSQIICLPSPVQRLEGEGHVAHAHWAGVSQAQDGYDTAAVLSSFSPDWVVVDHYSFDAVWHAQVRAALDCKIVVIDDLADRNIDATLIVDHNIDDDHRTKYAAVNVSGTRILGGPHFALLDPLYAAAPRHQVVAEVRSIGIFMGGVDAIGATDFAWDACRDAGFKGTIEVATTSGSPSVSNLLRRSNSEANTSVLVDSPNLADFFRRHDVQIGAGGGASWERCCIGAPAIVVQTADNQAVPIAGLAAEGAALTCARLDKGALTSAIAKLVGDAGLRERLSLKAQTLVDGDGAFRVAAALHSHVDLRSASEADARYAFDWRNDANTRRYSHDSGQLRWEEHQRWWTASLAADDRALLIARAGTAPVGVLRLDKQGNAALVSIYVKPGLGGLGLGRKMLDAASARVESELGVKVLVASIRPENTASLTAFAAAGFVNEGDLWVKRQP